ncbi:hypothetical protein FH972_007677 [Carpinus fangiana]|nr:hypothetical protein FH972_007677 [Carpinus fangiana]
MNKPNNAPLQLSQRSPDIRYVVKDSIYRDGRALSVKTAGKEEAVVSTLVCIDSPRPLQPPKPVKPRASGLDDSFRILAKPRNYQEEKDGRMRSSTKDAPRLSYDGRLSQDACKSTIKLKELPRLSLDSRERSIRGFASETKSSFLVKDLQRRNVNSSNMLSQQQEPESTPRTSSVVAKLMGLEAFPQSTSTSENPSGIISSCRTEKSVPFSKASRTDGNKQNQISGSPRNSHKDPTLDRLKNVESVMRPTSASRFSTEPAPWRQPDGSRGSQQTAFKYEEGTPKASNSSLSVYGEIEQRLAKLEFKKSGKDLRALKQILETMQKKKEALDTKREQAPNFGSQTSNSSGSHQTSNLASPRKLQHKDPISSTVKGSHSPKSYKSPAVIMKPVNLIRRTCDHASNIIPAESISGLCKPGDTADWRKVGMRSAKDLTPRSNHLKDHFSPLSCSTDKRTHARTSKSTSALKVPGHIIGEKNTCSITVSPRLQQRNFRLQQQSPHTISLSDSSKTISQCTRQPTGSNSPGRKIRLKSHSLQQCNDQLSKTSSDMRDLSHQGDTISLQSESYIDTEVTSTNQSDKINTTFFQQYCQKQENPEGFGKDRSMLEPAIATLEQPSPVSVLDATFYRDESPSPVKKISNAFQDYEPDEGEWNPRDLAQLQKTRQPRLRADIDDKKLDNIQNLVQNLQQIDCTEEDHIINYIAPLQEGTNSDHRYISEILLASGLLRDLDSGSMTVQLQVSGYPINYNVLLALEQTKASAGLLNDKQSDKRIIKSESAEKIQRLLIFDIVNEILARKLLLEGPPQQWFSTNKLPGRKTRGQQLLEELCSEVDQLQNINRWEDLMYQLMDWTDCHSEIPGVVLDVERLIFKDLITEIVYSEGIGRRGRPGRPCRKLLSM